MSHRAPPTDRVTEQSVREAAPTLFAQRGCHGDYGIGDVLQIKALQL